MPKTRMLARSKEDLAFAASIIKKGGIVAFPTETVYGLGADVFNANAVKKIFKAKGRPSDNPLIVHISKKKDVFKIAQKISKDAKNLMNVFWPGALTLVLKKKSTVPDIVTCGLNTIAVRFPKHDAALSFITLSKTPIAAPSANVSGKPSPTEAEHVIFDLNGKVDAIIDGGKSDIGLESTVIDTTDKQITLLRPGGVSIEEIEKILGKGKVIVFNKKGKKKFAVKSPGMKYRHYSPSAKVIIVQGEFKTHTTIKTIAEEYIKAGKKIGIISFKKRILNEENNIVVKDEAHFARELFSAFRKFDENNSDFIIVEGVKEKGMGLAIMNRLRKAAYEIINV